VAAVDEGLTDAAQGRMTSNEELGKLLDERFKAVGEPKRTRR
jgi:predicted transcriptional regulator